MARSRLLVSPMVPYCQNLPDTPYRVALTLELTIYKLNRGTKLVACLSIKNKPQVEQNGHVIRAHDAAC